MFDNKLMAGRLMKLNVNTKMFANLPYDMIACIFTKYGDYVCIHLPCAKLLESRELVTSFNVNKIYSVGFRYQVHMCTIVQKGAWV